MGSKKHSVARREASKVIGIIPKDNSIEACMEGLFMRGSIFHVRDSKPTFLNSAGSRCPMIASASLWSAFYFMRLLPHEKSQAESRRNSNEFDSEIIRLSSRSVAGFVCPIVLLEDDLYGCPW
jgi:hypothetical protein